MAEDRMALLETLRKATAEGDVDLLGEGVKVLAQAIMEPKSPNSRVCPRASGTPSAG